MLTTPMRTRPLRLMIALGITLWLAMGWARADAAVSVPANGIAGVTAADLVAGAVNADYRVSFVTTDANPAGVITVAFPAGYTIGAAATLEDLSGNAGRVTLNGVANVPVAGVVASPATRTVAVVLNSPTALSAGLNGFRILTGITNPHVSGATGVITVTTDAAGETGAGASVVISPGALSAISVTVTSLAAGAVGDVQVVLKTANPLPADARVVITFPAGFQLNSGGVTQLTSENLPGGAAVTISGQTATVLRLGDGAIVPAGTTVQLALSHVRNPLASVQSGMFVLQTQTAQAQVIDSGTLSGSNLKSETAQPTSGHKVLVCHKGRQTLSIAAPAWPAHQRHGDTLGACFADLQ